MVCADRCYLLMLALVLPGLGGVARAQMADAAPGSDGARIERLERMLQSVVDENRRLSEEVRVLQGQLSVGGSVAAQPSAPNGLLAPTVPSAGLPGVGSALPEPEITDIDPLWGVPPVPDGWSIPPATPPTEYRRLLYQYSLGYDHGFVVVPDNLDESPFSMKVNNQNTFRYMGFVRGANAWTDSAGVDHPIYSGSNFQIPRGRLIFSGAAFLPKLSYLLNIDYNTVTSNPIGFRAYALSYRFSRAFEVSVGQNKVPGSREWLSSSWVGQEGPDRSMATTFFRPSLSQGIWFTGEPLDKVYYHAMLSNGFNTLNLRPNQLNNRFCWSGSAWWEPWGEFGPGYTDIENHKDPALRLGSSYTYDIGNGSQSTSDAVENSAIRLSDGTIITAANAFAPGRTLQQYDLSLLAIDAAFKYRGLSLSTEVYLQNLLSLKADGPLPIRSTSATGGVLQGGYYILPQVLEVYGRSSYVTGHYGAGSEIGAGFNWFPLKGKNNLRYTFDTTWLDQSPADQNRTGYVAGQTGFLLRTQISTSF